MTLPNSIVFLVDVDNTLLDNDRIQDDLKRHLEREFGPDARERYWAISRSCSPNSATATISAPCSATGSSIRAKSPAVDVVVPGRLSVREPFVSGSLEVLERLAAWGPTVILSDGDVVFQPRKVERSGLFDAVDGRVLIYIHKEQALDDVERRYPAEHYVLVDDKLRILTAVKNVWGDRVTTVFPRQGQYAHDPKVVAAYPPADVTIERIGDLLDYDLPALLAAPTIDLKSTPEVKP